MTHKETAAEKQVIKDEKAAEKEFQLSKDTSKDSPKKDAPSNELPNVDSNPPVVDNELPIIEPPVVVDNELPEVVAPKSKSEVLSIVGSLIGNTSMDTQQREKFLKELAKEL